MVGGRDSEIQDFPYMAALEYDSQFFCGASIISNLHILTAAHCVEKRDDLKLLSVRLGSSYQYKGGKVYRVVGSTIHEQFGLNELNNSFNDIALLKLNESIRFDETKQPIELFEVDEESTPGVVGVASGWGYTSETMRLLAIQLQSVDLAIVGKEDCLESYKSLGGLKEGEVCAKHYGDGVKSPCFGDSGGPLVIGGRLAGIAAHVEDCGNSTYPKVFTEVAHFRHWVDEELRLL